MSKKWLKKCVQLLPPVISEQQEVLNYKKALDLGVDLIKGGMPFSNRLIQKLHIVLMTNARGTSSAGGEYRKIQNFIGPDSNIEHAVYIPVSAAEIPQYMENLEYFMNGEVHSSFKKFNGSEGVVLEEKIEPLIKIAIMHAQFESVHPFGDGNGRLGRILIALMAMSYDLVDFTVFLVSEELAKERARYDALLNGIRGDNPDWYLWIKFFLECCERMTSKLIEKMKNSEQLAKECLSKCRLDTEKKVWMYTFQKPYCKVSDFDSSIGSTITVRKALNSLSKKLREIEYTEIMICLEYCKTESICKFMNIKTGVSMIIVFIFTICNILLKVKFQSLK